MPKTKPPYPEAFSAKAGQRDGLRRELGTRAFHLNGPAAAAGLRYLIGSS